MSDSVKAAKMVLTANTAVLYGIFGMIESSGFFPPREFLNQFLQSGHDPCDQDRRMDSWSPFALSPQEYLEVKEWWQIAHAGANEDSLGADCWDDWVQEILNR